MKKAKVYCHVCGEPMYKNVNALGGFTYHFCFKCATARRVVSMSAVSRLSSGEQLSFLGGVKIC